MTKILIGADPEVFIKDPKSGEFLSAHDIIPGTKHTPFKHPGGACQVDGTAMEFNVTPSPNASRFLKSIEENLSFLSLRLRDTNPDLLISCSPTAHFDAKYFHGLPLEAKEMGCDPDFNAYTGTVNPPPTSDKPIRSGGGHVHIGWTNDANPQDQGHILSCIDVTRQLDVALFIPSLLFDKDHLRRSLYGRPGAFRPKPYGCEYRVLSNRWVKSPILQRWVFNTTLKAVKDLLVDKKYWETIDQEDIEFFTEYAQSKTINQTIRAFYNAHPDIFTLPEAV